MSLYPGAPRQVNSTVVLDDTALQHSMALAIDDAMKDVFKQVKGRDMPDTNPEDRRILFVAIARGVLQYLSDHQGVLRANGVIDGTVATVTVRNFQLDVTMDTFNPD